jgi:hypothetical protein
MHARTDFPSGQRQLMLRITVRGHGAAVLIVASHGLRFADALPGHDALPSRQGRRMTI